MNIHHSLKKPNLIFDLDGTLYPMTPEFKDRRLNAAAEAAVALGFEKDFATAKHAVFQSLCDSGYEMRAYIEKAADKGISRSELEQNFLRRIKLDCLRPNPVLQEFLHEHGKSRLAVLTHSTHEEGLRVLRQIGLEKAFHDNAVIGIKLYRDKPKDKGDLAFEAAAKVMDARLENCVFVEDSERNLCHAHELGMTTVLIRENPRAKSERPSFVDEEFASIEEFIRAWREQNIGDPTHARRIKPRLPTEPLRKGSEAYLAYHRATSFCRE